VLLGAGACGVALLIVSLTRVGRATDPLLLVVLVVQADLLVGVLHRKDRLWLSRSVAYAGITIALTFTAAGLLRALHFQVDLTQIALAVLLAVAMGVVLLGVGERLSDGLEKLFFPERVRVDRQLAQARSDTAAMRQRLERLERLALAGELASRVAHEIKNPLAAVRGYAELLLTDDGHASGAALRQKAARIIKEESDRINDAVTGLLVAARPGPEQPVRSVVALEPLVLSALALVETEPGAGRVQADLRDGPLHVRADPDALRGALLNLLRNALESCAGQGDVRVTAGLDGGRVLVEVTDEGAGLSPALGARLFEPFATTKPLGTGLGLVIARSAVEAAGGTLTLTNRADRTGAVARLALPCATPTDATPADAMPADATQEIQRKP
jgi:signal transduction histidine kinase